MLAAALAPMEAVIACFTLAIIKKIIEYLPPMLAAALAPMEAVIACFTFAISSPFSLILAASRAFAPPAAAAVSSAIASADSFNDV